MFYDAQRSWAGVPWQLSVPRGNTVTHKQEEEGRKTGVSWRKDFRIGQYCKAQDDSSSTEQSELGVRESRRSGCS